MPVNVDLWMETAAFGGTPVLSNGGHISFTSVGAAEGANVGGSDVGVIDGAETTMGEDLERILPVANTVTRISRTTKAIATAARILQRAFLGSACSAFTISRLWAGS